MKSFMVTGDSHAMFFSQLYKVAELIEQSWEVKDYYNMVRSSSTIRGLRNQPSYLNIPEQIEEQINRLKPEIIVFAFGQVDSELGFYYRKFVKGEEFTVNEFIDETIQIYKEYLLSIKEKHGIELVIKGVNPTLLINQNYSVGYISNTTTASIKDADKRAAYKQKVMDELPDYDFRFELNRKLNDALKVMADELGVRYFDIWDAVMDYDTGVVKNKYIPAPWDHHLADSVEVRKIHYDALYKVMKDLI